MTILTQSFVLSPMPGGLLHPRVGYRNLFREGTVTVSSAHGDHPKELAFDGFTYDAWRSTGAGTEWLAVEMPSAADADYLAVAAHTLAGCELTPQSSTDGAAWTDEADAFQPADNSPIVWEFDKTPALYRRLLIENAPDVVSIGAIHVGERLELDFGLPVGFQPPSLNEDIVPTNVMSEGGQSLGRNIVRRGVKADVGTDPAGYAWARDEWLAFIESAQLHAFFFWWAFGVETEIVYGGLESHGANFRSAHEVAARFSMKGIIR